MNQASGNEELLETARDCFRFITKFFEPINVSAVHIYHSALELSPLSSIVRRLYYHRRQSPFQRVAAGIPDAWEEIIYLHSLSDYDTYTWSPCGRFVAVSALQTVDIQDPLSSELLFTLTPPDTHCTGQLSYSPDGHSLALRSRTSLTIWDIQTGGVTRQIECSATYTYSLAWSLDGATICAIAQAGMDYYGSKSSFQPPDCNISDYAVDVYNVASGTTLSAGTLRSRGEPHLWAHNTSFRVIAMEQGGQPFTIDTFEVGSILTKVESFHVKSSGAYGRIGRFSPTTYRISISNSNHNQLCVLDVRNSECLLEVSEEGDSLYYSNYSNYSNLHCFSPDGSLFAVFRLTGVHIWKYTSGCYTLWREFPLSNIFSYGYSPLQFSPASSSILGRYSGFLQVRRLDSPLIAAHPNGRESVTVVSSCGTYIITGHMKNGTVTITNLLSPTPSQFIDTVMDVSGLALTGNVLLVWGQDPELVAWRLTERGTVYGVSADRRASRGDSIWTVSDYCSPFSVEDQIVVITDGEENVIRVYHTGTGDVLGPAQAPLHPRGPQYDNWKLGRCQHYPYYRNLDGESIPSEDEWPVTLAAIQEGWVKDLEGKHRMWVPVEWRVDLHNAGWLRNTTLLLYPPGADVIVRF